MQIKLSRILLGLALPLCLSSGCIAVGGSDNYNQPTLGKQLMDLKTARDTGAISNDEYDRARNDLIAGKNRHGG